MQAYWTSFAKGATASRPDAANGRAPAPAWPAFAEATGDQYLNLAAGPSVGRGGFVPDDCAFWALKVSLDNAMKACYYM